MFDWPLIDFTAYIIALCLWKRFTSNFQFNMFLLSQRVFLNLRRPLVKEQVDVGTWSIPHFFQDLTKILAETFHNVILF